MKASIPLVALATGTIILAGLAGCSNAPRTGQLTSPVASGDLTLLSQAKGQGPKDFGAYTAAGTVSVSGSCVGQGVVKVSLPPTGETLGIGCSPATDTAGQLATVTFALGPETTFHVKVNASSNTKWILAAAASGK